MRIWKEFTFDAAHRLSRLPPAHPCSRLHGHTYRFRLHLEGVVDVELGWIMDFADLKHVADQICYELDHRYLNEIPGLENPTAEWLAAWIFKAGRKKLGTLLVAVELFESSTTGVWYGG